MNRPASMPAAAAGFGPGQPVSTALSPAKPDAHRHAILSPSSADRWIHCPPSALLNAVEGDKDTVYTREGTLAHAVCELKARKHFLTGLGPRKYQAQLAKLKADELWQDEMDGYTDAWLDALKGLAATYPETPYVALEQRVDFSEYVPDGYGTADCIMIGHLPSGDVLNVVDFKYGKGIEVFARENPQMMLYALGALLDYDPIYDIKLVQMTIVQPRIKREPDTWMLPVDQMWTWANGIVAPAAKLAAAGEGEFQEGDWCRFCAIRGSCRARAEANLEAAQMDFKAPAQLTDTEVADALSLGQRLKQWLSDVEEYALAACLEGRDLPGWKAVEGRSVRAWTDADAALDAAQAAGIPVEMLYERKPVTLAALEKLMGKKPFAETLGQYVTTPAGKPTLAKADDRRPAITNRTSAEEDFGEEIPF